MARQAEAPLPLLVNSSHLEVRRQPRLAAFHGEIPQHLANGVLTSGRRTPEGNAAVGGVSNSWHLNGDAVDYSGPNLPALLDEVRSRFPGANAFIHKGNHVHAQMRGLNAPYFGRNGTKGR